MAPDEEDSDSDIFKRSHPLRTLQDVNGYTSVFMPGTSPCFILKSSSSEPKVIGVSVAKVQSLVSFNSVDCPRGIIFSDENVCYPLFTVNLSTYKPRVVSAPLNSLQKPTLVPDGW